MVASTSSMQSARGALENEPAPGARKIGAAAYGYGVAALAVIFGWLLNRNFTLVNPEQGLGYWLGIIGGSLMAVLLLYPVRKRLRIFAKLGATRHWFRMHMIFGVVGPILILYHSNFHLGSLNSNVALICTLLVAGSGLVGRYLYTKIFSDLDGHRRTLGELSARARLTPQQQIRAAAVAPQLMERLQRFDAQVLKPPQSFIASLLLPPRLAVTTRIGYLRLAFDARREIGREAKKAGISRSARRKAQAAVSEMIGTHLRRVRRVAEFHSYERMFSLWHIFHLPFFYILVMTALLHVLAVHMY